MGVYEISYMSVNSNLLELKENMVDPGVVASGCLSGLDSDRPLRPRDVLRRAGFKKTEVTAF